MLSGEYFLAEREMHQRVAEERSRADAKRLARRLRSGRQGGLSWQCRWLLCELGYWLVGLGDRLERYSLSKTQPV
jgi:hypothetical protein